MLRAAICSALSSCWVLYSLWIFRAVLGRGDAVGIGLFALLTSAGVWFLCMCGCRFAAWIQSLNGEVMPLN